jgi:hypothetical protein
MKLTQEMLAAAMSKAVETGLIRQFGEIDTYTKNWSSMQACLQAALDKADVHSPEVKTISKEDRS